MVNNQSDTAREHKEGCGIKKWVDAAFEVRSEQIMSMS